MLLISARSLMSALFYCLLVNGIAKIYYAYWIFGWVGVGIPNSRYSLDAGIYHCGRLWHHRALSTFAGWRHSIGWLVRSFVNILPTTALAGRGAFYSYTYLLYKLSYSKFTVKIFVTMATGVGLRRILLPQLNCSTPKTPCLMQELRTSPV